MAIATIGGYQFTHVLDMKKGAIIHLLIVDGMVLSVQNNNGRIKILEGMSLQDAQKFITNTLKSKAKIKSL